ncbi:MAG: TerB N-terminal domain-containing protein [Phycisphaerales bacterium]
MTDFPIQWHGPGSFLEIAGFRIADPLTYASRVTRRWNQPAIDPSEITLEAPVVPDPDSAVGMDMGYWPWYSRIHPTHRHRYLAWLGNGRTDLPPDDGYLFLYYYGLERRLLVEQTDAPLVFREVVRLRALDESRVGTRAGASFRRYSTALLWFATVHDPTKAGESTFETARRLTERWTPELLNAAMSWLVSHDRPLRSDLAFEVARGNPKSQQSVVTKRVSAEFKDLFTKRYDHRFAEGVQLRTSKRDASFLYRPANNALTEATCRIANPAGIPSQFDPLCDIWNSCVEDLRGLSRYRGEGSLSKLSVQAWEALPSELRADIEHPLAPAVFDLVAKHGETRGVEESESSGTGECFVTVSALASLLGVEAREKLTAVQTRRIAEMLEQVGYGIEPDGRAYRHQYRWSDSAVLFPILDDNQIDRGRFLAASCLLHLGLFVALADGHVDPAESQILTDHIETMFELPPGETRRLEALRAYLLRSGADIAGLAGQLQRTLSDASKQAIGRAIVGIAAVEDGIDSSEMQALRRCYRMLGLTMEVLNAAVAQHSSPDGLVTVAQGERSSARGEPLPKRGSGFVLDRAAIASIMADTREVSQLLAEAMRDDDELSEAPVTVLEPPAVTATTRSVPSTPESTSRRSPRIDELPDRLRGMYAVLTTQETWTREQAEHIARDQGCMLAGAIEALNDWAFEVTDEPLIEEDGDTLHINSALL